MGNYIHSQQILFWIRLAILQTFEVNQNTGTAGLAELVRLLLRPEEIVCEIIITCR